MCVLVEESRKTIKTNYTVFFQNKYEHSREMVPQFSVTCGAKVSASDCSLWAKERSFSYHPSGQWASSP